MYYALFYDYVPDVLERRKPYRDGHIALATELHRKGTLVFAGAFDPPDAALYVFQGTAADVEEFVSRDPYVANGIVTGKRIRPWNVVVGGAPKA